MNTWLELKRLTESIDPEVEADIRRFGIPIGMRPWIAPTNQDIYVSYLRWAVWTRIIRTINAPASRWDATKALVGLKHQRIRLTVVDIARTPERPGPEYGLVFWRQSVVINEQELATGNLQSIFYTKIRLALASCQALMTKRLTDVCYVPGVLQRQRRGPIPADTDRGARVIVVEQEPLPFEIDDLQYFDPRCGLAWTSVSPKS